MPVEESGRSLRYLRAADVRAAMPPLVDRLALAERVMRALGDEAELPPKIGVHPRQTGSLAHAMPALLRGAADDGSADLFGVKWIVGVPQNVRAGLPAYSALVLVNDSTTGVPVGIVDGGPITAERTAAISGVAIRQFAPPAPAVVAVLGAGVQARAHLHVIGEVLPGSTVRLIDTDRTRAEALATEAGSIAGVRSAAVVDSVREAVKGAAVVVSVVSFGPDRQALDPSWLAPDVLFVAVDYDMEAPAALAREALFVTDDVSQFVATRSDTVFAGYPDPNTTIGAILRDGLAHPPGRILVSHLGVGLADVVFASAVLERAAQLGLGRLLDR